MNLDQVIEGIGKVIAATKPAEEYCLVNLSCMTKTEWASWVQAIGSIAAIAATWWLTQRSYRRQIEDRTIEARQQKISHLRAVKTALNDFETAMSDLTNKLKAGKHAPVKAMATRFRSLGNIFHILFEKGNFNEADEILLKSLAINSYTLESIRQIYSDGFDEVKAENNEKRTMQLRLLIIKLDAEISKASN